MVLDFEYGINTGNRFLQFVDHDEEPEDFIAAQAQEEEKQKKSVSKDVKQSTKQGTTKTTTSTTVTAKTNKENLNSKSTNVDQRRQQSATVPAVFSDNNNQQTRADSARGLFVCLFTWKTKMHWTLLRLSWRCKKRWTTL